MANTYALIQTGSVVNIIMADPGEPQDPAYTWVDITAMSPQPAIGWAYDGTNFTAPQPAYPNCAYGFPVSFSTNGSTDTYTANKVSYNFPHGTPQANAYLYMAIQVNLVTAQMALQSFVGSRYTLDIRFNFNALYILATQSGLTNRATYITKLFTWAAAVVAYAAEYAATVSAMTNTAVIVATVANFSTLLAADPLVTPLAAIQINN